MSESQNIEWKSTWRDEYLKWVCGFANANGGKIYIGKNDTGEVVGVEGFQKLMEDIPNKIISQMGIICDVNLHKEKGKHYIEIVTKPYDVPISYHGAYYYRSGSTKQELTGAALNEFLLRKMHKTWDDSIEPSATLNDIDEKAIEAFKRGAINSNRLPSVANDSVKELLQNLRLLKDNRLNRAAVLLFGKDPQAFLPTAYLKIGRFGASDADLLFQDVVESNAFELADKALEILEKKYLIAPISYEGIHRVETLEYPREALREALLNAIIHRTYTTSPILVSVYENKLMIWNEGKLPEMLTPEDLKHKHNSFPKNPVIAGTCFKGGLIEAWGRGTVKIIDECRKHGLPDPEISLMGGGVVVTLYKAKAEITPKLKVKLNERQEKAIEYVKKHGNITNKQYQELFKISRETASRDLAGLTEKSILISSGTKGAGSYFTLIAS